MKKAVAALVAAIWVSGCSFAPEYHRPEQELPASWGEEACERRELLSREWWRRFQDETLNELVASALAHNRDLAQSLARVEAARASLGMARSELFPQFSAQGSGERSRASLDATPTYGVMEEVGLLEERVSALEGRPRRGVSSPSRVSSVWSGAVQAAWELDIWGRYRNAASAAEENLLSAEEARRALELSVAGQVCSAYFDMLNYAAQRELSERTLASRESSTELYEKQYAAGAISELDILNARTQVDELKDSLAQAKTRLEQAESALLLLTGASPERIFSARAKGTASLEDIVALPQLPEGLPSELLNRRPDILSAEAALRAAHFQVGEARAAFFPSISLTAGLGAASAALNDLFTGPAGTWSFGGSASFPIFTFGRTLSSVRQAEASLHEAAAAYEKAVQQAFSDIRSSLAAQQGMAESVKNLAEASARMEKAANLARARYAAGYSPYLDVLEAERTLYGAQMNLASRRASQLSAIVQVCVALGGGW
ncbi:efflux transporter outer membrane subunit [Mailhella massiliensis]|uniref:Efflux transporter outer membrane subunit n=1 Tax=Mailhella massiliensis TaxID=1903261 RepID=A0A921AUN8_9BACT|nr:efflux transporter outer membrane subunit [Mailhella massiliensis]HJD96043.1 efflux transporter outer membrane subunit [Mailhella massiliensis]